MYALTCQKRNDEIQENINEYNKLCVKMTNKEQELIRLQKLFQEKQDCIKNYEAENVLSIKKYDEACAMKKEYESKLNESQKVCKEKQNEIIKLMNDAQTYKNTLEQANIRVKKIEDELARSKEFNDKKIEMPSDKVGFSAPKIPVADIKLQVSQKTTNECKNIFPKYNQEPPIGFISKPLYSEYYKFILNSFLISIKMFSLPDSFRDVY